MTDYTDLKEAAEKATEAHAAYKADNAFQNELAWHDAEARFRLVATRARILSLIEENERMREALESIAEPPIGYADLNPNDLVIILAENARAALREKQP